ncbi:hypothetical protein MKX03_025111 [Papaver bracteatum]|nr:hypothetical protein MKX03_025111 [Papaver bracteatum]
MSNCRGPEYFALLREDYPECLHHAKEATDATFVYNTIQKSIDIRSGSGEAPLKLILVFLITFLRN